MHTDLLGAVVRTARRYRAQPWYDQVYIAALTAFVILFLLTAFIGGGDALHGHQENGRYFVLHHHGAPEHEVSPFLFEANLWLLRSIGAVVLLRCFGSLVLRFRRKTQA